MYQHSAKSKPVTRGEMPMTEIDISRFPLQVPVKVFKEDTNWYKVVYRSGAVILISSFYDLVNWLKALCVPNIGPEYVN